MDTTTFNEAFARRIIADLVNNEVLVKQVNGQYTLTRPLWGYQGDIAFKDKDQAIDQLVTACKAHYGGLRAAS